MSWEKQSVAGSPKIERYTTTITGSASTDGSSLSGFLINGAVSKVTVIPSSPAPTAGWTFELRDADGIDVMGGAGASQDDADKKQLYPLAPSGNEVYSTVSSQLEAVGTGIGNGAKAIIHVDVIRPR